MTTPALSTLLPSLETAREQLRACESVLGLITSEYPLFRLIFDASCNVEDALSILKERGITAPPPDSPPR